MYADLALFTALYSSINHHSPFSPFFRGIALHPLPQQVKYVRIIQRIQKARFLFL